MVELRITLSKSKMLSPCLPDGSKKGATALEKSEMWGDLQR